MMRPKYQGSYASGKCQGILFFFKVREFYVVSGNIECLLKSEGNVREFFNFQFVSNDEEQKMASLSAVFLTVLIQAKSF